MALRRVIRRAGQGESSPGAPLILDEGVRPPHILACLDLIEGLVVKAPVMMISGWAITPTPLSRVEIHLGHLPVRRARLGMPRPDVAVGHPQSEAVLSGFQDLVDLTTLELDAVSEVVLVVEAVDLDGVRHHIAQRTMTIHPWQRPSPVSSARVVDLIAHQDAIAADLRDRLAPPTALARPLVLVYFPDLHLGGAQLRMAETVIGLRASGEFEFEVFSVRDGPVRERLEAHGILVRIGPVFSAASAELYESRMTEALVWAQVRSYSAVIGLTLLGYPVVDLAGRLGIPAVWDIHESIPLAEFFNSGRDRVPLDDYIYGRVRAAFVTAGQTVYATEASREIYREECAGGTQLVIRAGIDVEGLHHQAIAHAELGRPDGNAPIVLCVGAVAPHKSQAVLVQAAAQLARQGIRAQFVVVGAKAGPYVEAISDYAQRLGLHNFTLVGEEEDPFGSYRAAALLVCPSDNETLPSVILEAMALEVPVLASDLAGIRELAGQDPVCRLVGVSDVGELADAIAEGLAMPAGQREALTGAAYKRVVEEFLSSQRVSAFKGLLHSALS